MLERVLYRGGHLREASTFGVIEALPGDGGTEPPQLICDGLVVGGLVGGTRRARAGG